MPEETAPFRAFDVAHVRLALAGSRFADIRYQARTGSTNEDALPHLADAAAAGATFVADEQTAGRGRKAGRAWIAPPGTGLLFTTILPTVLATGDLWAVPFWVALCVADGIGQACGVHIDLRWPNDLFIHDRKVGGILCISRVAGGSARIGCGVGINVVRSPALEHAGLDAPAGFLADAAPRIRREVLLAEIVLAFERRLPGVHEPAIVARTYEERAALRGSRYRVRLDLDDVELEGVARGLGADGTLRLDVNGTEHAIALANATRL